MCLFSPVVRRTETQAKRKECSRRIVTAQQKNVARIQLEQTKCALQANDRIKLSMLLLIRFRNGSVLFLQLRRLCAPNSPEVKLLFQINFDWIVCVAVNVFMIHFSQLTRFTFSIYSSNHHPFSS